MLTFVFGGCHSGKSLFAEQLLQSTPDVAEKHYIATMWPEGRDARERIEKHRAMRKDKGFTAHERYTNLGGLELSQGSAVLLECLGTLVANEMFQPEGAGTHAREVVSKDIRELAKRTNHLIVVGNEVGSDGGCYDKTTREYQQILAAVARELCAMSDVAVEMVCGIPVYVKGENFCQFSAA